MITDKEYLNNWLERDDAASRPYRAQRLELLVKEYGQEGIRLFHGGPISARAFEEARQAYLHGLFIACTIMCQVCLEHMLSGMFRTVGRDDLNGATFERLLLEARSEHFLSNEEFELFNRLRKVRNPYAHARPPLTRGTLERRALEEDSDVDVIVEEDAEMAIKALLSLCQRPPFALPPD